MMIYLKTIQILLLVISDFNYVRTLSDNKSTNTWNPHNNNSLCTQENCIMKCCKSDKYIVKSNFERICNHFENSSLNFVNLVKKMFNTYPDVSKLNFNVKAGIFEENELIRNNSILLVSKDKRFNKSKYDLTKYPAVEKEVPNIEKQEIPNNMFCWDYQLTESTKELTPEIWFWTVETLEEEDDFSVMTTDDDNNETLSTLFTTAMFVSCFFLLLVLVVYGILPELRNLGGQILMAYVASLFTAFLLLGLMRLRQYQYSTCRILTYLIYFGFISSFCWMNVMSYDIWWTFRSYAMVRSNSRSHIFKFIKYSLYGFGLPLGMTATLIALSEIDMSHISWFIIPLSMNMGCFLSGRSKFIYLYIPMLILILSNWLFYLMTAFYIRLLTRGTTVLNSAGPGSAQARRTQRHRLIVYLKLSAVMGLSWIMEIVSYVYPTTTFWILSDLYNILIGLIVFLIFVCKRKILKSLAKKFLRSKEIRRYQTKSSVISDTSSLEFSRQDQMQQGQLMIMDSEIS